MASAMRILMVSSELAPVAKVGGLADAVAAAGGARPDGDLDAVNLAARVADGERIVVPVRGAVTWKSIVGTNVAADALSNLASPGVTGGVLIVVGEDYGEGSSIMQERSHAFAMKSQIWLFDPRPDLPSMVHAVEKAFELSEASHTPVMVEVRIRACHVHGRFKTKDNVKPGFTLKQALENPIRDVNRIVLPPANFLHEHEKINKRWPAAVEFIKKNHLNEFLGGTKGDVGIVVQGGLYNTLIRALQMRGLADSFGETDIPIYVLNVTYPLIDSELKGFCADKRAVLVAARAAKEALTASERTELVAEMAKVSSALNRVIGQLDKLLVRMDTLLDAIGKHIEQAGMRIAIQGSV